MLQESSQTFFEDKTIKDLKCQLRDQRAKYRQLQIDHVALKKDFGRSSKKNDKDSEVLEIRSSRQQEKCEDKNEFNERKFSSSTKKKQSDKNVLNMDKEKMRNYIFGIEK